MDTKIINAQNAPAAVGPYCHAVEAGDFVFTSGQIGLDPQTQELKEGVAEQTKQDLIGRAWVRIYPFDNIGVIRHE